MRPTATVPHDVKFSMELRLIMAGSILESLYVDQLIDYRYCKTSQKTDSGHVLSETNDISVLRKLLKYSVKIT
jgi:hypothetical protein